MTTIKLTARGLGCQTFASVKTGKSIKRLQHITRALPKLTTPAGKEMEMPKESIIIGSDSAAADICLTTPEVAPQHAKIEYKSGRMYCTALSSSSPTNTWLNGSELRAGVAYMVAPDATLSIGQQDTVFSFNFAEQGSAGGVADLLLQGMAAQATPEVQKQLKDIL